MKQIMFYDQGEFRILFLNMYLFIENLLDEE